MTEEEAKTKWCPFVRAAAPADSEAGGTAGNRWGSTDPTDPASGYLCIASACMAWRWEPLPQSDRMDDRRSGFCGLAGAPQ